MAINTYHVIGLMSGTSLDGLDISFTRYEIIDDVWSFSLLESQSLPYTSQLKKSLQDSMHLTAFELIRFHNEYGTWLGKQVLQFIKTHKLEVDFIASHGHTVFHQPDKGVTYQIGSGQHLANASNYKVICDFRTNDVLHGGQGAPLVPIGDQLLFGAYDYCLNLGGFSNISYTAQQKRIAYDISPVNMMLNYLSSKIDMEYDHNGVVSQSGKIIPTLAKELDALPYYYQSPPKSLGKEWFTEIIIPLLEQYQASVPDLLHTATLHIATQISNDIKRTCTKGKTSTLFITGGGAKNSFLINSLREKIKNIATVIIPEETIIDFKEAILFGFMGVLKERNEVNCLQSVTGASRDSSSGVIFFPA